MQHRARNFLLLVLPVVLLVTSLRSCAALTPPTPSQPYWHNWADANGESHFTLCALTNWSFVDFLPPSQPLWQETKADPTSIVFLQMPVGWQGPWHRDPAPQLVVFLSGHGRWQTMDGQIRDFTTGDLYFGNDQMSTKGHFSQNIGNVPLYVALLQFADWNVTDKVGQPCWLK